MNDHIITSPQNPRIKELISLGAKSSERRKRGLFLVEGARECRAVLKAGYFFDTLFWVPEIADKEFVSSINAESLIQVSPQLYEKIAYRGTTEGIIAIVRQKELKLNDIKLSNNPLIIVLESVEKPGNLGAVLRTADAAKADAVIICEPLTDIYNPNTIRSSLGGLFTNQVATCSSEEAYEWLKENQVSIFTAELQASEWYHLTNMSGPMAIVMGTEADGLKDFWRERADKRIKIPMRGELDSLNVSVSTAIICFEALRQRDFN
ncbi:MAG: RNA methyltransferase [Bacteroidales bacterium]|nr:RNA methyltransferase [Bacteroidales bacterium]